MTIDMTFNDDAYICTMKRCLYSKCRKDFEPKVNKAVYCSDNCRKYANKEKIASLGINSNDIQWIVLVNGTKIKYEEKNMELILSKLGVRLNVINRHNEPNEIIPKVVDEKPKIKTIDPHLNKTISDDTQYKKEEKVGKSLLEYQRQVAEYQIDGTITPFERQSLAEEIEKSSLLEKDKKLLINGLKN